MTAITRTACPSWCAGRDEDGEFDDAMHRVFLFDADPLRVWLISYENDERPEIALKMDDPEAYLSLRMAAELIGRLSEAVVKALELEAD